MASALPPAKWTSGSMCFLPPHVRRRLVTEASLRLNNWLLFNQPEVCVIVIIDKGVRVLHYEWFKCAICLNICGSEAFFSVANDRKHNDEEKFCTIYVGGVEKSATRRISDCRAIDDAFLSRTSHTFSTYEKVSVREGDIRFQDHMCHESEYVGWCECIVYFSNFNVRWYLQIQIHPHTHAKPAISLYGFALNVSDLTR